jgi:hypothetical protein
LGGVCKINLQEPLREWNSAQIRVSSVMACVSDINQGMDASRDVDLPQTQIFFAYWNVDEMR